MLLPKGETQEPRLGVPERVEGQKSDASRPTAEIPTQQTHEPVKSNELISVKWKSQKDADYLGVRCVNGKRNQVNVFQRLTSQN